MRKFLSKISPFGIKQEKLLLVRPGEHGVKNGCYHFHPPYDGFSKQAKKSGFGTFEMYRALHISGDGMDSLCDKYPQYNVWGNPNGVTYPEPEECDFLLRKKRSWWKEKVTLDPSGQTYNVDRILSYGSSGF